MSMPEIHLTKKDFRLEWYSGQGAGGQHRNKHQNCCRITHIATGLKAVGTESAERTTNQRVAFTRLANLILAYYAAKEQPQRRTESTVIRNYHAERNEVHDRLSGLKQSYRHVVDKNNLGEMIEARREHSHKLDIGDTDG